MEVNGAIVIEDVYDMKEKSYQGRHKCIVQCMYCHRVSGVIPWSSVLYKRFECPCRKKTKRHRFKDMKGKMLKFLVSERNKAKAEMLFDEDLKRIEEYDRIINFLQSYSLKKYFLEELDEVNME